MSGFNVVHFTVKEGMDNKFLSENKKLTFDIPSFKRGSMIKTGEHDYCFIAEWDSASESLKAEEKMVTMLDCFRDTLEDKGEGVTDFYVGDSVVDYH